MPVGCKSWRPIETAPKDGTEIILYEDFEPIICKGFWSTDGDEWRHNRGGLWKMPTHWMPLPEPPQT